MTLSKGQKLGPYEIIEPAGAGGMGEVYKAKDTRLDRTVAIKVLPEHAVMNSDARARFEREAKTISCLNHPNICVLHDIGHHEGIDFLVMEYLAGETLEERLKKGRMDSTEVLEIAIQISGALCSAHSSGLVHRDLKPSNILLTKEGAKLLDFGLAKLQSEVVAGMDDNTRTTPVTGAGMIVGTLQYMSPEQLEGREADARSDIFSFGATVYEMLTGSRAFSGESKASLIGSIMREVPRSVTESLPTLSPALDRTVRKCLAKNPDDRWQTARDLKDELEWIASGAPSSSALEANSTRRWPVVALAALLVVVTAASTILWLQVNAEREKAEIATQRAEKGQQFLSDVLASSFPWGYGDETTVLDIVDYASQKLNGAFPDEPELEYELRKSLGHAYDELGHYREAKRELTTALTISEREYGKSDDRTLILLDYLHGLYRFLDEREACLDAALAYEAGVTERFGATSAQALEAKGGIALAMERAGRIDDAREEAKEVWSAYLAGAAPDSSMILDAQIQYAWLLLQSMKLTESQKLSLGAYDLARSMHGDNSREVRDARSVLAATHIVAGDIEAAKELYGYRQVPDTFGIDRVFQGQFDAGGKSFKLLVFFETWCPYSRLAMADLARIDRQYRQFGLDIVGMTRVSGTAKDEDVDKYIEEMGIDFTVVKENGRSWNYFGCQGTPSIRLLSDGYLIWEKGYYTVNAISVAMLESLVASVRGRTNRTGRSSG